MFWTDVEKRESSKKEKLNRCTFTSSLPRFWVKSIYGVSKNTCEDNIQINAVISILDRYSNYAQTEVADCPVCMTRGWQLNILRSELQLNSISSYSNLKTKGDKMIDMIDFP